MADGLSGDDGDAIPEPSAPPVVEHLLTTWSELAKYRADYGAGYVATWFGVPHLNRQDGLQRLLARKQACAVLDTVRPLGERDRRHLEVLATINAERSNYALRTALLLNISSPIAISVALGQLFPAEFRTLLTELDEQSLLVPAVAWIVFVAIVTVLYCWIRSRDAIELRDILRICCAPPQVAPTRSNES